MWNHSPTKRARFRRPLFAALAVLFVVAATVVVGTRTVSWAGPFDLPKGTDPIIGDLGGVPVSVPLNYTHLITEYDGDPSVFDPERRKWKPPVRTFASKINSLPLMVHFPDYAPRTPENEVSYYRNQKAVEAPEEWLPIGVRAGERFFIRDEALKSGRIYDRKKIIKGYSGPTNPKFGGPATVAYEKQIDLRHGLVEYLPVGFEANEDANGRNNRLFFFETNGKDVTFIKCHASGHPFEGSFRNVCTHTFTLYPWMKAEVVLRYDARSLSNWQEYEQKVRDLIFSFRVSTEQQAGGLPQ